MKKETAPVGTTCQNCYFSIEEEVVSGEETIYKQVGCRLNRDEKFRERGVDVHNEKEGNEEFYSIDRVCTCFRPQEWFESLKDNVDGEHADWTPEQIVMYESRIRIGVLVCFFKQDYEECENPSQEEIDIEKTISSIAKQEGVNLRYVIVLNDRPEYHEFITDCLEKQFGQRSEEQWDKGTMFHVVQCLEPEYGHINQVDEAFRHFMNGYVYLINSGQEIEDSACEKLNKYVTGELHQLVMVKPKDDKMNHLVVQTAIYKYVKGSRPMVDDETMMVDSTNVADRIEAMGEKTDSLHTIVTWEEINGTG